ncbi:hypothetical protein KAJ61_00545 [Candidatus Parcubacteria bacterium]|nr:hypothetical protein [Candidatus Parcubacteria bacterium]
MEDETKKEKNLNKPKAKEYKYLLIGFSFVLTFLLVAAGYFLRGSIDLKMEINRLTNEISKHEEERIVIKNERSEAKNEANSLKGQIEELERKAKTEERLRRAKSVYKNDKYNFLFYHVSYVSESDLAIYIRNQNKTMEVFKPAKEKYQDGQACGDNERCIVIQGNKYFREPDKITVIDKKYQNIEQAISSLIKEKGFDINNCQLKIEDFEHGKRVWLKLSDEKQVSEEDIKKWEDENGLMNGAYSTRNIVSQEKTKLLCSEYGQPEMPVGKFFIFNEDRKDVFLFYESSDAERWSLIYSDTIQILNL